MGSCHALVRLTILDDEDGWPLREFTLADGSITSIGRSSSTSLPKKDRPGPGSTNARFDSPVISRVHASLTFEGRSKSLTIKDHSSMHGTFVNDKKLYGSVPERLRNGDVVRVGANVVTPAGPKTGRTFCVEYDVEATPKRTYVDLCAQDKDPEPSSLNAGIPEPTVYLVPDSSSEDSVGYLDSMAEDLNWTDDDGDNDSILFVQQFSSPLGKKTNEPSKLRHITVSDDNDDSGAPDAAQANSEPGVAAIDKAANSSVPEVTENNDKGTSAVRELPNEMGDCPSDGALSGDSLSESDCVEDPSDDEYYAQIHREPYNKAQFGGDEALTATEQHNDGESRQEVNNGDKAAMQAEVTPLAAAAIEEPSIAVECIEQMVESELPESVPVQGAAEMPIATNETEVASRSDVPVETATKDNPIPEPRIIHQSSYAPSVLPWTQRQYDVERNYTTPASYAPFATSSYPTQQPIWDFSGRPFGMSSSYLPVSPPSYHPYYPVSGISQDPYNIYGRKLGTSTETTKNDGTEDGSAWAAPSVDMITPPNSAARQPTRGKHDQPSSSLYKASISNLVDPEPSPTSRKRKFVEIESEYEVPMSEEATDLQTWDEPEPKNVPDTPTPPARGKGAESEEITPMTPISLSASDSSSAHNASSATPQATSPNTAVATEMLAPTVVEHPRKRARTSSSTSSIGPFMLGALFGSIGLFSALTALPESFF